MEEKFGDNSKIAFLMKVIITWSINVIIDGWLKYHFKQLNNVGLLDYFAKYVFFKNTVKLCKEAFLNFILCN